MIVSFAHFIIIIKHVDCSHELTKKYYDICTRVFSSDACFSRPGESPREANESAQTPLYNTGYIFTPFGFVKYFTSERLIIG